MRLSSNMADTKMNTRHLLSLLALFAVGTLTNGQPDTNVCMPQTAGKNDPKMPSLPDFYSVHVECNILNRKFTAFYEEYYDYKNNRAAVHITNDGIRTDEVFSYATNELFSTNRDTKVCTRSVLSNSTDRVLFGYSSGSNGKAQIFTAKEALMFNATQRWINQTIVRGIQCNLWRSCVYWKNINATMTVDWYFSAPGWETSALISQVPVRAHVTGKTWTQGKPRDFEHIYEFDEFRNSVTSNDRFETPPDAYCPMRTNRKPLPTPPKAFHFTAEILFTDLSTVGWIKEFYDYNLNIFRYDFTPVTTGGRFNQDTLTRVHDFNTGVAYVIDMVRGNCTAMPISRSGLDDANVDAVHVRLRSSREFFYFDKTAYVYEGTRTVRGMLTDVWIAKRTDWPPPGNKDVTSIWEWYFATGDYSTNLPDKLSFGMPVRMTLNGGIEGNYVYNIYAYDEQKPFIWDYDISKCFNYTEKRDFNFLLPGNFRTIVNSNMKTFKYAVLAAIQGAAGVTALRVSNVQTDFTDNSNIRVKFTLLDKAPPIGDVVNPKSEPDLNTAATALATAINNNALNVTLATPSNPNGVTMTAKKATLTQHQHITQYSYYTQSQPAASSSGFSGGAMAGMGVALLVVFFILSVGATYIYYRRMGGAFLPKRFDNTDITKDTS